ncbi:MAG: RagB/SusD family nutrient uptake outer membrane protein, partial [Phocaeicola sp.]|nr:RagB/SusD family nutrient uptake outer membrane protein [Phocaeicola sp.]
SQFVNNTRPLSREEAIAKIDHKEEAEFNGGAYFKAFEVTTPGTSISDLMYQHRDKRFDASIIHDGSVFLGEDITTYSHGNMSRWATQRYASDHVPLTNYSTRKYIYTEWSPRPFYNVYTDYHKILFRYGRALLNKAEALLRLNKVPEAVAVFNQTRTTHGGLPASEAATLADAWKEYKIERRVELFWEGDWYFSLLRWGKYGMEANDGKQPGSVINELTEPATFIEIKTDRTAAYVGNVQLSNDARKFDVRSYLFPITKSVIQANSAINESDQNPGWE